MFIALLGVYFLPLIMDVCVQAWGFAPDAAAWQASAQVCALALGSMASARWATRWHRMTGCWAALVMSLTYVLCYLITPGFVAAIALNVAAGLSGGVALTVVTGRIAATSSPDALYGRVYAATSVAFAVLLFGAPWLQDQCGPRALFGELAVLAAGCAAGLSRLPPLLIPVRGLHASSDTLPLHWRHALLLAVGMSLSYPLYGGVYALTERAAVAAGLSVQWLGAGLAGSTLLAVCGALAAARWGARFGRTLPLGMSMLIGAGSYALILSAQKPAALFLGLGFYGLMSLFFNAYVNGTAAALDPSGRVAAALQGYALLPYALGPGLMGGVFHERSLPMLAAPAFILNLVAFLWFMPVTWRLDRAARASTLSVSSAVQTDSRTVQNLLSH